MTSPTAPNISTAQDATPDLEEALNSEDLGQIKRKSVGGVISFLGRTAVLQAVGLVSTLVLSIFFSPEDFGIYGVVTQIIGLLVFFSDIGLAAALVQKKDQPSLTEYRTAFTVQQALSWLIVGVVLIILTTGVVQGKTGEVGAWLLVSLAISFPLATLKTIPSIMLERKLEFSKLVVPQIFEQLVFHGLLITLAWRGMGAMAYTYAIIIRSLVGVVVMWVIQPWRVGLALDKVALFSLLGYGMKFQLNDFLARIKDQLFFLFLAAVLPLREFGFIQWAKNWSQYPYNLTVQNVMAITFPTFSRLQGHPQALKRAIEKSIFFITLAIFPLLVGMSVFVQPLIQVIPSYGKWQPAMLSFILFTLAIGWAAISTPLVNTLNAIGHINSSLKLMLFWTVLTWVLTPIGLYFFDFNGVAIAAFVIALTSFLPIMLVKKYVPVVVWPQLWRQLVAAVVMAAVGLVWLPIWQQSMMWLLIGMLASGAAYAGALLLVGFKTIKQEILSLRTPR